MDQTVLLNWISDSSMFTNVDFGSLAKLINIDEFIYYL